MPKWVQKWTVLGNTITRYNGTVGNKRNSVSHVKYVVSVSPKEEWGCSCPHWRFRRLQCHHIDEVKAKENWRDGDPGNLLKLTAMRIEQLRALGKTEKQIDKDLSELFPPEVEDEDKTD